MSQDLNSVVLQRIEVAPGLIILRVAPDGWEIPEWEAGQFGILGLPYAAPRISLSDPEGPVPDPGKLIRRAYSIASGSEDHLSLELVPIPLPRPPSIGSTWSSTSPWSVPGS